MSTQPNAPLNEKQKIILQFIRLYTAKFLIQPTDKQIAEMIELSLGRTEVHLRAMRQKGWITKVPTRGYKFTVN